jgi:intracellular multiplication protein IcmL
MVENQQAKKPASPTKGKASPRTLKAAKQRRPEAVSAAARGAASNKKEPANKIPADIPPLGSVTIRNEFYRDGYRSILKLAVLQSVIVLALVGAMFFVIHTHQPENRYFATTEDGRLIPMVPLNAPNLSTPALMSWVAQAATEVMTFGFNDYRRRLQEASRNFTPRGWESFTQALQRSRIIEMVETQQQVATAAPRGAPILQSEGLVMGRYQWKVQLPMIVTYQSGTKTRSDNLLLTLTIVRVPRLESSSGVGISQWIAVLR